jgi:hypothetical protein
MEKAEVALGHMPSPLARELKGIAAGAGIDFTCLFATNIFQYDRSKSPECSNVIVFGDSTKDGRLFHIRTFDFRKIEIFNHQVVSFYHPTEGIPFMGILIPGNVRLSSGTNKKMVSVGINTVHRCRPVIGGDFSHYLARYIVQFADDMDEAMEIIMNASPITNIIIVTVADAKSRRGRVFEIIGNRDRTFRDPHRDFIISTNHLITTVTAKPTDDSKMRYRYYENAIEESYGNIDLTTCLDFLKGYAKYRKGDYYHCYTIHAIVFDPEQGKAFIALKPPFPAAQGKFHTFHFKEELR